MYPTNATPQLSASNFKLGYLVVNPFVGIRTYHSLSYRNSQMFIINVVLIEIELAHTEQNMYR